MITDLQRQPEPSTLTFCEEDHIYKLGDVVVPGVSQILMESGIIQFNPFYTEAGKIRGKYVHSACEMLDQNDLDFSSISPEIEPYVTGYQLFLKENTCGWLGIEERVFNKDLFYAGTLDRRGVLNGQKVILDIKTGVVQPHAQIQTAAYRLCFKENYERCALQLKVNGTYKLHHFGDANDMMVWESAVQIVNWKKENPKPLSSKGNGIEHS